MRKIFLAFMILIVSCSCSFAAENDDVYVRKDLFEAYMKNIDSKLDKIDRKLENIDERLTRLEARGEGVYVALSNRIEGVEKRFDDLRTDVNIGIALVGLIAIFLGLPVVQKWLEKRQEAKQNENIEKIFEKMFEAKMKGNLNNAV